jgi:hypothetical protein
MTPPKPSKNSCELARENQAGRGRQENNTPHKRIEQSKESPAVVVISPEYSSTLDALILGERYGLIATVIAQPVLIWCLISCDSEIMICIQHSYTPSNSTFELTMGTAALFITNSRDYNPCIQEEGDPWR